MVKKILEFLFFDLKYFNDLKNAAKINKSN
jgi:hypothetical protein